MVLKNIRKKVVNNYFCQKHFFEDFKNLYFNNKFTNYHFCYSFNDKSELLLDIDKRKIEYSLKCNYNFIKERKSHKMKFRKEFNY